MQVESIESYIKEKDGDKGGGEETDLHFKPPGGDLCGQILLSLSPCLCPAIALAIMLPFCLTLTDLLRGRDQNDSPAPTSSLAFSTCTSTDSFPSLVLSVSPCPTARDYILQLSGKEL